MRFRTAIVLSAIALGACSSNSASRKSSTARLSGRVTDRATGAPIAGAIIAIENGGLDVPNPDPSKPNPSYQVGAIADDGGLFSVTASGTTLGVHAFASGYVAGRPAGGDLAFESDTSVTLALEPVDPSTPRPTVDSAAFDDAHVSTGAGVTLRVHASAPVDAMGRRDPLAEATLVVEPVHAWAAVLAPPSPAAPDGSYPDGAWQLAFVAPKEPGAYVYRVVATTRGGLVSDVREVGLEVR